MSTKLTNLRMALPQKTLSNTDLGKEFPDYDFSMFESKVGIRSRHVVNGETESALTLALSACSFLQDKLDLKNEVDYIIYCSQSPEYLLPNTACLIQHSLELRNDIGAIDLNLGCSAFPYAVDLANKIIDGDRVKKVLIVTAETYSKYIHPRDRANRAIFGDAATACLVEYSGGNEGQFIFLHGTDGGGARHLLLKNGARFPLDGNAKLKSYGTDNYFTDNHLYMNGPEVFKFTLDRVPGLFRDVLDINNESIETIDYFVFHQANYFMLETLRKLCGIPRAKFLISMESTGNTVSNTIPIVLYNEIIGRGRNDGSCKVLILGFGVGLSWSGGIINV